MPYGGPYICTECGKTFDKEALTVVNILFKTMGVGPKIKKSRTLAWLCTPCLEKHPSWNLPDSRGTPSHV